MNNDLIDRYIYAITKRLPRKNREDVKNELNTLISDMLEDRCKDLIPTDKDVRVVLTELGTPDELAYKYNTEKDRCLIGGIYYIKYKTILRIVLLAVLGGMTLSFLLLFMSDSNILWYEVMMNYFYRTVSAEMSAFAFVTLLFAYFYRKGVSISTESIDDLPEVPHDKDKISIAEPVIGIIFTIFFAVIILTGPQLLVYFDGEFINFFNVEVIRAFWYVPVLFAVLGIINESVKIIEGTHTWRLMITTIVTDLLSFIIAVLWLTKTEIINQNFINSISSVLNSNNITIFNQFQDFILLFLGIMLFALMIDIVSTVAKTIKYN